MEGVGDEVFYFGLATIVGSFLLYKSVIYCFNIVGDPTERMMTDSGRTRSSQHDCAICLDEATFAVETNCGHVYCGNCLLEVKSLIYCCFFISREHFRYGEDPVHSVPVLVLIADKGSP